MSTRNFQEEKGNEDMMVLPGFDGAGGATEGAVGKITIDDEIK